MTCLQDSASHFQVLGLIELSDRFRVIYDFICIGYDFDTRKPGPTNQEQSGKECINCGNSGWFHKLTLPWQDAFLCHGISMKVDLLYWNK